MFSDALAAKKFTTSRAAANCLPMEMRYATLLA